MTQKRFIKLLMSLGLQRNTANAFVRRIITENTKKSRCANASGEK